MFENRANVTKWSDDDFDDNEEGEQHEMGKSVGSLQGVAGAGNETKPLAVLGEDGTQQNSPFDSSFSSESYSERDNSLIGPRNSGRLKRKCSNVTLGKHQVRRNALARLLEARSQKSTTPGRKQAIILSSDSENVDNVSITRKENQNKRTQISMLKELSNSSESSSKGMSDGRADNKESRKTGRTYGARTLQLTGCTPRRKPPTMLVGHRDYNSHDSGDYSEGISDFIASGSFEEEKSDSEKEIVSATSQKRIKRQKRCALIDMTSSSSEERRVSSDEHQEKESEQLLSSRGLLTKASRRKRLRQKHRAKHGNIKSPCRVEKENNVQLQENKSVENKNENNGSISHRRMSAIDKIRLNQIEKYSFEMKKESGAVLELSDTGTSSENSNDSLSSFIDKTGEVEETMAENSSDQREDDKNEKQYRERKTKKARTIGKESFAWQSAIERLGLRQRDLRENFAIYCEWLVYNYIDPSYLDTVHSSPKHKAYYYAAIHRIEEEIIAALDAVHSEAWRSCSRGLLEAIEMLPASRCGWNSSEPSTDNIENICAACNRSSSHVTRKIRFYGLPILEEEFQQIDGKLEDEIHAVQRLSQQYMKASQIYRQRRGRPELKYQSTHIEQKDDEVNPDHKTYHGEAAYCNKYFWVGEICASRLFLYHALHHWKWRLVSRLKEELKRELRHRREMNPRKIHYCVTVADSILEDDKDGDTLIQSLYDNFRGLVQLAEPFKLAGGEDSDIGRKEMSGGNFMNKVDLISQELYENQGIPESSVEWDESSDEKEEGDISIVARAEGENSPEIQGGNAGNEHEAVSSPAERNNADIIDQD